MHAGESLTDALGPDSTPAIGLVHTAWGGSMIEEWVTDEVAATCSYANHAQHNEDLYDNAVRPYLDMTVKGFVWYQVGCWLDFVITVSPLFVFAFILFPHKDAGVCRVSVCLFIWLYQERVIIFLL